MKNFCKRLAWCLYFLAGDFPYKRGNRLSKSIQTAWKTADIVVKRGGNI